MLMAHVMAGAPRGGAELFYERITAALAQAGETIFPIIRTDPARATRLEAARLCPIQLRFGGPLDLLTRPRLRSRLRALAPNLVMAWMGRAAAATPRGDWVLVGRLGGRYDLRRFQRCDHLVANTHGLARWITEQGWPAARTHVLPNFVPSMQGAAPARLPVPPGSPVVLALGRLHRNKAFDVLVRALPRLPGIHAVIAGEGPERDALLSLARREAVADRLHLIGWQPDTAALLAAADLLVCPSRVEPLGNVVLEAFSAAIPVVAAASDGPRETIRANETGLLVPIDDAEALATSIATVLGTPAFAAALAAAGHAEWAAHHAEAAVVARWRHRLATLGRR